MSAEAISHSTNLSFQVFSALFLDAEIFQVFEVNPSSEHLDLVEPLNGSRWTGEFIGLSCGAGDQVFVYNPSLETFWSQQTNVYRDGMKPKDVTAFMSEYCAPKSDVPTS